MGVKSSSNIWTWGEQGQTIDSSGYTHWQYGELNNSSGHNYLMVDFHKSRVGSWIAAEATTTAGFVCQVDAIIGNVP